MQKIECTLKEGINTDIGRYGLAVWMSYNAWQQEYHTPLNVDLLYANGRLANSLFYMDGWKYFKGEEDFVYKLALNKQIASYVLDAFNRFLCALYFK